MDYEISPMRRFCCFDNQTIYQFHPFKEWHVGNPCDHCAFRGSSVTFEQTDECLLVPCDALHRADKTDGFWQKSKLIDYQQFKKMLKSGG